MNRAIILIFLLLPPFLLSSPLKSMSADYDVSFGIFGDIGKAHCDLLIEKGTYKISIKITSRGLVKFFSQDRTEVYESTGLVKNGVLIPQLFVKNRKWGSKEDRKKYLFDHKNRSISILRTTIKDEKSDEKRELLPYFAVDDILTLFFNLDSVVSDTNKLKDGIELTAVGANKKDGHLDLKKPDDKIKKIMKNLLGVDNNLLLVTLNQKIFSSKNGEFMIDIDKNGICDRFVLKDVLMYGDLYGEIKNFKIKE
jgi:hypothetical protein